ncbi:putative inorganic phosphate cotransporter [Homalodisca vitripennis]|uniref:putative inorganic phosphate cotransporter n=1 Tax=Homalodisca vitripennis TaxID=197043 RepID=UPI001EECC370|nr:putative inorganic phosphate cotransporter [Homalodisca vitripennis]
MKITEKLCVRIRHRYLLVLMMMTGMMLTTMNCLTFSLLLDKLMYKKRHHSRDEIVCPQVVSTDHHPTGYEEFDWGKELQLYIVAAWSVGYVMGRFPTGLLANKLGAKSLYGYSVFITGICALLTPLCARSSPYIILANRVCSGIFASALYPCIAWFAAHWFPGREMGFMISLTVAGFPLGCMVTFPFSHKMYHIFNKWATAYYAMGGMTIIWAYLWQAYIWDYPFNHPRISRGELEFLADGIHMYAYDTEVRCDKKLDVSCGRQVSDGAGPQLSGRAVAMVAAEDEGVSEARCCCCSYTLMRSGEPGTHTATNGVLWCCYGALSLEALYISHNKGAFTEI